MDNYTRIIQNLSSFIHYNRFSEKVIMEKYNVTLQIRYSNLYGKMSIENHVSL